MAFGRKLWNRFKKTVDGLVTAAVAVVVGAVALAVVGAVAAFSVGMIIAGGPIAAIAVGVGLTFGVALTRSAIKNHFFRSQNPGMHAPRNSYPDPQTRPASSGPSRPYEEPTSPRQQPKSARQGFQGAAPKKSGKKWSPSAEEAYQAQLNRYYANPGKELYPTPPR